MRTLERKLYAALRDKLDSSVPVYPVMIPQDAPYPCVRYSTTLAVPASSLCGSSGLVNSSVQIDVWAHEFAQLRGLREDILTVMQQFEMENILQSEMDLYEPDYRAYQRILSFSVWEQERTQGKA
jgi:hypothetical protein